MCSLKDVHCETIVDSIDAVAFVVVLQSGFVVLPSNDSSKHSDDVFPRRSKSSSRTSKGLQKEKPSQRES